MASAGIEADLPSGPSLSPTETTFRWLADPFGLLDACAADLGDRFALHFNRFGSHVVVSHPDDVRAVFAGDPDTLLAGRGNALLEPILGTHSLLLADGDRHAEERMRLIPAFRPDGMPAYARLVVEATRRWTASWDDGATVSVQRTALAISREVILRAVLGLDDGEVDELIHLVERLMVLVGTNAPFDDDGRSGRVTARLLAARGDLVGALRRIVARRRRSGDHRRDDVLSTLLGVGNGARRPLADDEIEDQLVTMILAGHETTASSIAWALIALLANGAAHDRLLAEVGDGRKARDDDDVAAAPYLQAVCLETLRLFPVVPIVAREVARPFRLRNRWIPPGVFVTPCAYLAHRRPDSFAEPTAFRPERFLGHRFPPNVYFPFGGGVRRCLGMGFALLEMQIVLGMLVRAFRFRAADPRPVRPVRRAVTIVPSGMTRMTIERRTAA
ncbi:MAG TPA: cytochrome P450 [Candidatus Binatia bacterium]|nr:cytochrome P450 [Candidatus Binatia bacterium]